MLGKESSTAIVRPEDSQLPIGGQAASAHFGDLAVFASRFFAHPKRIGSIVPSSGYLERRIVGAARLADARCVVELGPGTGGTTRAILGALHPQARLLAIELDPQLHARLHTRMSDPRLIASQGTAESLGELLQTWRLPSPDVVISGIPFSTMDESTGERIAAAIAHNLAPGGRFVAYQVRAHVAGFVSPLLGPPTIGLEWRNWPPMRIFCWRKAASLASDQPREQRAD